MEGKGLALDITMQADSLANFSGLAGNELPPLGPLAVSGRLSDREAGYQLEGFKARVGKTDVSVYDGSLSEWVGAGGPTTLGAEPGTLD